ncbi:hypothetical protein [Desulfovibrio subterraneus]|jgi:hypothetical protein|uniref:Uncharacterized protein n=1 Tax=Desulfovibrio subterraneus TaxID=2718620 RepID=A0A7J0BJJ6_9BACT|nr:hypothetical protein [Desulfovibrio subterraneus]GFM33254.1 hypothetical protein DSM101010T_16190 [Desulfovibrio subterraneus]
MHPIIPVDWERPLTPEEKELKEHLLSKLPPIVARKEVGKLTGGWLDPKTVNNEDYKGNGPKRRFNSSRKVLYRSEELIDWAIRRFGMVEVKDFR